MSNVFFDQLCPSCGHTTRFPIESLGGRAQCTACRREFVCNACEPSDFDRNSLLLVIRDVVTREEFTSRFTSAGYQVTAVSHPRHALEAATMRSFDVVILEFALPEFDGVELLAKLRMHIGELQAVVLVDDADAQASNLALQAGAIACLAADCPFNDLAQTAELAVDQARSQPQREQGFSKFTISRRLSSYRPANN